MRSWDTVALFWAELLYHCELSSVRDLKEIQYPNWRGVLRNALLIIYWPLARLPTVYFERSNVISIQYNTSCKLINNIVQHQNCEPGCVLFDRSWNFTLGSQVLSQTVHGKQNNARESFSLLRRTPVPFIRGACSQVVQHLLALGTVTLLLYDEIW